MRRANSDRTSTGYDLRRRRKRRRSAAARTPDVAPEGSAGKWEGPGASGAVAARTRTWSLGDRPVGRRDRGGQDVATREVLVDRGGGRAALRDRPHDQRLTTTHVTGGEHALHVRGERAVAGHVAALVQRHAQFGQQPALL